MAGPAILLEIITYIFQCTPPTCECDEPLRRGFIHNGKFDCHFLTYIDMCWKGQVSFSITVGGGVRNRVAEGTKLNTPWVDQTISFRLSENATTTSSHLINNS